MRIVRFCFFFFTFFRIGFTLCFSRFEDRDVTQSRVYLFGRLFPICSCCSRLLIPKYKHIHSNWMYSCGSAFGPVSKCKFMFGARATATATARAIASSLFSLQPMYDSQLHLIISCYYSVHTHSVLGSAKPTTCSCA